jgi:hypothetical protein
MTNKKMIKSLFIELPSQDSNQIFRQIILKPEDWEYWIALGTVSEDALDKIESVIIA